MASAPSAAHAASKEFPVSATLLVSGASGHLGQAVLHHLLDTLQVPASRIVAATRQPGNLAALAARGVAVRAADFDDPASLAGAFAGVQRLLLISTDALDRSGRRLAQHRAAIQAAGQAGVQHVVYTSMPLPEGSPIVFAPDHAGTEAALASSRLPGWTVLRNHWYFENLLHSLPAALASGRWYSAAGDGRLADIARDDLARAAAVVLAGDSTGRQTFTLSGPQALTTAEIAQQVSRAAGKPLQVVAVPLDALVQGMVAAGLPRPVAEVFASFDTNTAAGRAGTVTDDYRRITGRAPQSFADWLAANTAAIAAL
jgi:NAD(P)H dehydrogenase (quinone)